MSIEASQGQQGIPATQPPRSGPSLEELAREVWGQPPQPAPYGTPGAAQLPSHQPVSLAPPANPDELEAELAEPTRTQPKWWQRVIPRRGPSAAQIAAQVRQEKLLTTFGGPVTIIVASPKGSAGKTPTARGIAAAFAAARGGGVAVVDNNELRGTLLARSVRAPHDAHIGNLVPHLSWFDKPEASALNIEHTMHRQPGSHEWVLGSDPRATIPMDAAVFGHVHRVLTKFYPIVIVDTGNNELASNWRAALSVADLVVVPMKWRGDHLAPAARMLAAMQERGERVLGRTVIVGTNGVGEADPVAREKAHSYFSRFASIGLPLHEIPTDPALGAPTIEWSAMRPATRVAYENVAAHLADLMESQVSTSGVPRH